MTFLDLVLVFVGFALAVLVGAALVGRVRGEHLRAVAATLVALWALTAVFDNVMIAAGLFDYGHELLVVPTWARRPWRTSPTRSAPPCCCRRSGCC